MKIVGELRGRHTKRINMTPKKRGDQHLLDAARCLADIEFITDLIPLLPRLNLLSPRKVVSILDR